MNCSFLLDFINKYCICLEYILIIYSIGILILKEGKLRDFLYELAAPLLFPIRKLIKKSVMQSKADFSVVVVFMILLYIQAICSNQ